MNPSTSDTASPTVLISPNAAQEFIALQSAEIARLRADVDQLRAQVRASISYHDILSDRL